MTHISCHSVTFKAGSIAECRTTTCGLRIPPPCVLSLPLFHNMSLNIIITIIITMMMLAFHIISWYWWPCWLKRVFSHVCACTPHIPYLRCRHQLNESKYLSKVLSTEHQKWTYSVKLGKLEIKAARKISFHLKICAVTYLNVFACMHRSVCNLK